MCQKAVDEVKLLFDEFKFLNDKPMRNTNTYKLFMPRSIFGRHRGKIVSVCECPTEPAIYFVNRSIEKSVRIIAERPKRTISEARNTIPLRTPTVARILPQ